CGARHARAGADGFDGPQGVAKHQDPRCDQAHRDVHHSYVAHDPLRAEFDAEAKSTVRANCLDTPDLVMSRACDRGIVGALTRLSRVPVPTTVFDVTYLTKFQSSSRTNGKPRRYSISTTEATMNGR